MNVFFQNDRYFKNLWQTSLEPVCHIVDITRHLLNCSVVIVVVKKACCTSSIYQQPVKVSPIKKLYERHFCTCCYLNDKQPVPLSLAIFWYDWRWHVRRHDKGASWHLPYTTHSGRSTLRHGQRVKMHRNHISNPLYQSRVLNEGRDQLSYGTLHTNFTTGTYNRYSTSIHRNDTEVLRTKTKTSDTWSTDLRPEVFFIFHANCVIYCSELLCNDKW